MYAQGKSLADPLRVDGSSRPRLAWCPTERLSPNTGYTAEGMDEDMKEDMELDEKEADDEAQDAAEDADEAQRSSVGSEEGQVGADDEKEDEEEDVGRGDLCRRNVALNT